MAVAPIVRVVSIILSVGGFSAPAITVLDEKHRAHLEICVNPLETGVSITDHSFMTPLKLAMKFGVTNTPLHSITNDPFSQQSQTRVQAAFTQLRALQASGEPFAIQTGLLLYPQMLCSDCDIDQDASSANAIVFDAQFQEVIFVSTQTVSYPHRAIAHSGSKTAVGAKQAAPVDDTKQQTLLQSAFNLFFGPKTATTSDVKSLFAQTKAPYLP
jgi:hypothetical protein